MGLTRFTLSAAATGILALGVALAAGAGPEPGSCARHAVLTNGCKACTEGTIELGVPFGFKIPWINIKYEPILIRTLLGGSTLKFDAADPRFLVELSPGFSARVVDEVILDRYDNENVYTVPARSVVPLRETVGTVTIKAASNEAASGAALAVARISANVADYDSRTNQTTPFEWQTQCLVFIRGGSPK